MTGTQVSHFTSIQTRLGIHALLSRAWAILKGVHSSLKLASRTSNTEVISAKVLFLGFIELSSNKTGITFTVELYISF